PTLVRMAIRNLLTVWFVSWPVWACSAEDASDMRTETFDNEGELCMRSLADGSLLVSVIFPTCLSSTCSKAVEATCSVELDGERIVIKSHGSAEHGGDVCTADCGALRAECTSTALEPGKYGVVHGDASYEVMLPAAASISLTEDANWSRCPG